jgi:hypothetical protein
MSEIRISPKAQGVALLGMLAMIAAAIGAQLPELRRYLKIESM